MLGATAAAQSLPNRPLNLVVPFAAGGPSDVAGRILALGLSEVLGQQVVVENPSGAGGTVGSSRVAKAPPDGSQFVLGNSGHIQTIVCTPGNPKASFFTNDDQSGTPEEWLKGAARHPGSWWDHGVAWTAEHAGPLVSAPTAPGNEKYPVLCAAPGTYVHERG